MKTLAKVLIVFAFGALAMTVTGTTTPVSVSLVPESSAGSPCFDACVEQNCKPIRESAPPYKRWAACVKECTYSCQ